MKHDAAALLSRLKPGFLYRDHRLLEDGAYRELARKFRTQARRQLVLFGLFSVYMVVTGVFELQDASTMTSPLFSTVFGWSALAFGMASLAFWTWTGARTVALCDHVLEMLAHDEPSQPDRTP